MSTIFIGKRWRACFDIPPAVVDLNQLKCVVALLVDTTTMRKLNLPVTVKFIKLRQVVEGDDAAKNELQPKHTGCERDSDIILGADLC